MNRTQIGKSQNLPYWPACIGVEEASKLLGWPLYFFPLLLRAGHMKPLGKPAQNGRKWFARLAPEKALLRNLVVQHSRIPRLYQTLPCAGKEFFELFVIVP